MEIKLDDAWETAERFTMGPENDVCITISGDTIVGTAMNPEDRLFNHSNELPVFNGIIAGYDRGEFGGKVAFIPNSGQEYNLINENFRGFYTLEDRVFVLTGFSHMFSDKGHIYEIIFSEGKWQAEQVLDLASCPESYLLVDKTLYLATNRALLVIEDNKVKESITIEASWVGFYPNSLIKANSKLYVGIRGGMVSVGLDDRKITWYSLGRSEPQEPEQAP